MDIILIFTNSSSPGRAWNTPSSFRASLRIFLENFRTNFFRILLNWTFVLVNLISYEIEGLCPSMCCFLISSLGTRATNSLYFRGFSENSRRTYRAKIRKPYNIKYYSAAVSLIGCLEARVSLSISYPSYTTFQIFFSTLDSSSKNI